MGSSGKMDIGCVKNLQNASRPIPDGRSITNGPKAESNIRRIFAPIITRLITDRVIEQNDFICGNDSA